jgi:hypothetical protein
MSIGRYSFEGPFKAANQVLEEKEGVYAIAFSYNDKLVLIKVDESDNIKNSLIHDDRKESWQKYCSGKIEYWVDYTPNLQKRGRQLIVRDILREYRDLFHNSAE